GVSIPDYLDRRDGADALADSALYHPQSYNLNVQGAPERLNGAVATPSLFSTLGVSAALGRVFNDDEGKIGNDRVAVLSFALWKNVFGGDPGLIGRDVLMNGANYRVVGVMPNRSSFPIARRNCGHRSRSPRRSAATSSAATSSRAWSRA
ncbi:MAG TPA: ABC transporter permease, partial [Rudaea sp.]